MSSNESNTDGKPKSKAEKRKEDNEKKKIEQNKKELKDVADMEKAWEDARVFQTIIAKALQNRKQPLMVNGKDVSIPKSYPEYPSMSEYQKKKVAVAWNGKYFIFISNHYCAVTFCLLIALSDSDRIAITAGAVLLSEQSRNKAETSRAAVTSPDEMFRLAILMAHSDLKPLFHATKHPLTRVQLDARSSGEESVAASVDPYAELAIIFNTGKYKDDTITFRNILCHYDADGIQLNEIKETINHLDQFALSTEEIAKRCGHLNPNLHPVIRDAKWIEDKINEIEKKLHWWLLKLNYNDVNFFYWLTKKIKAEVKAEDTESKKINALYKCLKFVNQNQILISNRYNNKIPDIKQQITQWIEEEIEYRTKKVLYNSTNENIPNIINNKEKIHVGLSVAQLSWFVNLLVQSNIIKTKNQKDIIRFVADNFQTDNQKEISPTSLYSKYYNVESSTKETMKLKLIDLLNRTK